MASDSERVGSDQRSIASGDHLESLIDAAPFAIIGVARDLTVLLWNKTAEVIFGWSADEVLGQPLPFTGPDVEAERRVMAGVLLSGEALENIVLERTRKDGSKLVLSGAMAPVRDESGEVTSVIAIGTDITEQQRLQQELLQAQRMEAVGRLAGGVAHDFNNLLTAVLGNVEFLLDEVTDPHLREDLEAIRRAASRGSALTEQLLAIGRRQLLNPQVVDLNEVALALRPVLRRLLRDDVTLTVHTALSASTVLADPAQIEQVVLNLAVNARDAITRGGRVLLDVENVDVDDGPHERVGDLPPGPYVRMTVRDTGEGMDASTLAHAFDPFFTTKPTGQGMGLGLAAVYGIVTQSGGQIGITSEPGVGTSVVIHLPRTTEELPAPPSPPAEEPPVEATVLLVEDDRAVLAVCRRVLEHAGFQVLEASTGEAALDLARDFGGHLDVLVSDVVLPGMDGVELASTLRGEQAELRVLLMSGYSERLTADDRAEGDHGEILMKPFTPDDLTRRVRSVLDG